MPHGPKGRGFIMSKKDIKKDIIVGLDIGTTKIACVVAERVFASDGAETSGSGFHDLTSRDSSSGAFAFQGQSQFKILGIGISASHGLRKGMVVHVERTIQSIREAVLEASQRTGLPLSRVVVGIAGSHIQSFNSTGVVAVKDQEIQKSDIDRVLEAASAVAIPPDRKVLHIVPQEFTVDGTDGIKDPMGMSGVRLEAKVHIITGALSAAQNLIKCVKQAGLEVDTLVLQPLASARAVLSHDEMDLGVAMLDFGGGTTDLAVFQHNSLVHTASFPVGGNHITNDIAVGLRTTQPNAEEIKIQFGCAREGLINSEELIDVPELSEDRIKSVPRKTLGAIIEPRVEEMLQVAKREMDKHNLAHVCAGGLVITGGTALLSGLVELAEKIFDMPVKLASPRNIESGLNDLISVPQLATAVGLLASASLPARGKVQFRFGRRLPIVDQFRAWVKDLF